MPTYAERTDLDNFFSQANISDWADKDRDGELSETELLAIDAALNASEAAVDSYLARAGYNAPFEAGDYAELPSRVKALFRQWTVTVAAFHIYAWRGIRDRANAMERLYNQTTKQLRSLNATVALAGLAKQSKVSAATGRDVSNPTDDLDHLRSDGWDW